MELAPVLASLPASTSLHRLAGFLTGSLEARLAFAAKDEKYIRDFISPGSHWSTQPPFYEPSNTASTCSCKRNVWRWHITKAFVGACYFWCFLGGKCESGPWRDVHLCPMWKEVPNTDCLRQVGQCWVIWTKKWGKKISLQTSGWPATSLLLRPTSLVLDGLHPSQRPIINPPSFSSQKPAVHIMSQTIVQIFPGEIVLVWTSSVLLPKALRWTWKIQVPLYLWSSTIFLYCVTSVISWSDLLWCNSKIKVYANRLNAAATRSM